MATAKVTVGAVFGAIQSSAQSIVNTLEVGNTLISKAQMAASDSLKRQQLESILNNESFKESLLREKAMEDTQSELKIQQFMAQSQQHATSYESNYKRYAALLSKS